MADRQLMMCILFCGMTVAADLVINPAERLTTLFANNPEQIHLSLGSIPNDIIVMWSTKNNEKGYVEYGSDPDSLTRALGTTAELKLYSDQATKYLHRAELLGLTPGARYSYRIVSGSSGSKSQVLTFEVPHNDPQKQDTFLILADMGLSTKSLPFIIHHIMEKDYEVVFHIGDFAYNLHSNGGRMGDDYMNRIDNFTARVPYLTTPGDHESITGSHDHDREESYYHYRYRFSMPNAPWPMTHDSLWYSIDIGHTHFISINTDLFVRQSHLHHLQLEWLKKDLIAANQNRKAHPWIIVMGHKPMYCTRSVMSQDCQNDNSDIRGHLEDLLFEQGVDLYLSGHKHCYERTWPMYSGRVFQTDTINPMAPIYIIIGTLGYSYLVDKQLSKPYWLAFASSDREKEVVGRLNVLNGTHLIWSVYSVLNDEELENVAIVQKYHGSFGKAGPSAFDRISKRRNDLPPEPFTIIDEPADTQTRTTLLYVMVLTLSLLLFIFIRNTRVRKTLRLWV